jgi:hypothetical protein
MRIHHSLPNERALMRIFRTACSALLLMLVAACDTKVSNPGPVQDEFLNDRNAAAAMVNGAGRALAQGMNWISYTGAAVAREIHPAGSTGSFGITTRWQTGELNGDDVDLDTHWEQAQRARWLAEETLRRLEAAVNGDGCPAVGVLQRAAAGIRVRRICEPAAGREHVRGRHRRQRRAA